MLISDAQIRVEMRELLVRGFHHAVSRFGCKMEAYAHVARTIGAKPMWVRALIGRYEKRIGSIPAFKYLNAKAAFSKLVAVEKRFVGGVKAHFARIPLKRLTRRRYEVV